MFNEDDDNFERKTLKLYSAALEDDAGIDLQNWETQAGRLQCYLNLVERERALEKVRPVKDIPEPGPSGAVSPRTRIIANELEKRSRKETGPLRIKQAVIQQTAMPPSARDSREVAAQMAVERAAKLEAAAKARREAKAAMDAADAEERSSSPGGSPSSRPAWKEGRFEREQRMKALMKDDLEAANKSTNALRTELNAYRDLKRERVKELALLEAELDVIKREHKVNDGDASGLQARATELLTQVELADDESAAMEQDTLMYAFMQERLRMKRPHLEKKLAYLKSMDVELAVRLQVQQEAESVAVAYGSRMENRIAEAHAAFKAQVPTLLLAATSAAGCHSAASWLCCCSRCSVPLPWQLAEHAEKREGLKSELSKMEGNKRRAMGAENALTKTQLEMLQEMQAADHAEMQRTIGLKVRGAGQVRLAAGGLRCWPPLLLTSLKLTCAPHLRSSQAQHAAQKAEASYAEKVKRVEDRALPSNLAKQMAEDQVDAKVGGGIDEGVPPSAKRKMGKREAWQRLVILTGEESIKG